MKKTLLGLFAIAALGLFAAVPCETSPETPETQQAVMPTSPAVVIPDALNSELTAQAIPNCPNCCEVSEDGTRCLLCRRVCP